MLYIHCMSGKINNDMLLVDFQYDLFIYEIDWCKWLILILWSVIYLWGNWGGGNLWVNGSLVYSLFDVWWYSISKSPPSPCYSYYQFSLMFPLYTFKNTLFRQPTYQVVVEGLKSDTKTLTQNVTVILAWKELFKFLKKCLV